MSSAGNSANDEGLATSDGAGVEPFQRIEPREGGFLAWFVRVGVRGFEPLPFVLYCSLTSTASTFCAHRPPTFAGVLGGVTSVAV